MSPYPHHHHHRPYLGGIILIFIGGLFLLDNLGIADMSDLIHTYWPLILVIIGLSLLLRRSSRYQEAPAGETQGGTAEAPPWNWKFHSGSRTVSENPGDRIVENSTFGDVALNLTSKNFLGGTISTVFGDTEIDLSAVDPAPGEQVLRIHTVFGDTRVSAPKGVALRISADSSFGDMRVMNQIKDGLFQHIDFTSDGYATATKKLHLIVSHVFGDLRVW